MASTQIFRLPQVMQKTGMGRSSIFAAIKRGEFPAQVKLTKTGRASGWVASEIESYLEQRIAASRAEV